MSDQSNHACSYRAIDPWLVHINLQRCFVPFLLAEKERKVHPSQKQKYVFVKEAVVPRVSHPFRAILVHYLSPPVARLLTD
jgi:hypothetical protein